MKPFCTFPLICGIFLFFQICSANITEDLDNVYPFPFEASFEQSNTEDSIKELFYSCAHQGQFNGGNSIVNGYAQIVAAMIEYKNSKEPWFNQPFLWLKNNPAMIRELIKRNGYKLTSEHFFFVNYLLSSYKTIIGKPDWKIKFQKIKSLYIQYNNNWNSDNKNIWARENKFIITMGFGDDRKDILPDYLAWGLAKNWIGAQAYPSVFKSSSNKAILCYTTISFENYLASFWYRRWADSSMNTVYTTLKLISAFMPRNFEKQKSYGFVDSMPEALSRTGKNWELYPTPSAKITCIRVKEDGKTQVDSIWSATVPTAVKIIDFMPPVENYYMLDDSLLTPNSEGVNDTIIIKMASMESSFSSADAEEAFNAPTPEPSNFETDLKKFDNSDPVTAINNLTKAYDPYPRLFTYNKDEDLLKFTTPDINVELTLSDVKLQIVNSPGNKEFYIQFLCKDGSKCVMCSYTGPTSITAITVKNKGAAEKIVEEVEKLRNR